MRKILTILLVIICFFTISLPTQIAAHPLNSSISFHFPQNLRGRAALFLLGNRISSLAGLYNFSIGNLRELFQQPSFELNREGELLYSCDAPANGTANSLQAVTTTAPAISSSLQPIIEAVTATSGVETLSPNVVTVYQNRFSSLGLDAFRLHSLPSTGLKIYLDFTGHTTTGTTWNSAYNNGNTIVSQPFTLDSDGNSFSLAERNLITAIWARVSEDYSPFNVDVTTEDPGVEGLKRSSTSDKTYGIRVVISPTNWYRASAGGIAVLQSFAYSSDTPAFVFSDSLQRAEKYIAEAIAHEVGHTVNLNHDGTIGGTEYYEGQGVWAPIMGVGYYKELTQFDRGEYNNANNRQDDFNVISTFLSYRKDEIGNTLIDSSLIAWNPLSQPRFNITNCIENQLDIDIFAVDSPLFPIENEGIFYYFQFHSLSNSPNLYYLLEFLDSNGNILLSNAPGSLLGYSWHYRLSGLGERYYIRIRGIGNGISTQSGFSAYGSVGNYILTGNFTGKLPKPSIVSTTTAGSVGNFHPTTTTTGTGQNNRLSSSFSLSSSASRRCSLRDPLACFRSSPEVSLTGTFNYSSSDLNDDGEDSSLPSSSPSPSPRILGIEEISFIGILSGIIGGLFAFFLCLFLYRRWLIRKSSTPTMGMNNHPSGEFLSPIPSAAGKPVEETALTIELA